MFPHQSAGASLRQAAGGAPRLVQTPTYFEGPMENGTASVTIPASTAGSTLIIAYGKTSVATTISNPSDNVGGSVGWLTAVNPLAVDIATWAVFYKPSAPAGVTQLSVTIAGAYGWQMTWGIEADSGVVSDYSSFFNSYKWSHNFAAAGGITAVDGLHIGATYTYSSGRTWTVGGGYTLVNAPTNRVYMQYAESAITADRGGSPIPDTSGGSDSRCILFSVTPS